MMRSNDGIIHVEPVPKMADVATISHTKLVHLLRYCPSSDLFGQPKQSFEGVSIECLRDRLLKMIVKWNKDVGPHAEAISERSNEQSS